MPFDEMYSKVNVWYSSPIDLRQRKEVLEENGWTQSEYSKELEKKYSSITKSTGPR